MGCESGPAAKDRASRRRKAPLRCSGNNFARSWTGYATVLVLWLGQQELERGDFNLVGLGRGRDDRLGGLRRSLGDGGGGLPGSALLFEDDALAAQGGAAWGSAPGAGG